jgi:DNA polymerase-3 subunit beta
VLVPGRLFADIVRGLPPEPVELALTGAHLTVECAGFRYSVLTMPVDDYPERPPLPPRIGSVGTDAFAMAVAQVTVAAGRDLTLPLLTGVRLADLGDHLSLGCTDRYRMAVRPVPWRRLGSDGAPGADGVPAGPGDLRGGSAGVGAVLVPARALAEAAKALGSSRARAAAEVHLGLGDGTLGIECGDRRLICRLIEVAAPDYDARVPMAGAWRAEVETALLIETVKRVSLVAAPLSPVLLSFGPGEVRLEAGSGDEAKATATIGAHLHGAPIELAVKPQFLLDGLLALDSDVVTLTFTEARQPVLLTGKADGVSGPPSGGGLRYLTMPLRLIP